MLTAVIRFSLANRAFVLAAALALSAYGLLTVAALPVDVFPDLNRPTVTVMVEAPGLAAEEVEFQATFPIETALNGAPGVERVRSNSTAGLAVVYAEFGWETDIRFNRQVVQERLNQVQEKLPEGVVPALAPISSIMGEILLIGMSGEGDPMEIRSAADWIVRPRLLAVKGISQVTVMGGGVKQYQVFADPERMRFHGASFQDVEEAVAGANAASGGGFLQDVHQEIPIRNLSRIRSVEEVETSLLSFKDHAPIRLRDVAEVRLGKAVPRGDGSVNGKPAVILAVQKQPGADTLALTREIDAALEALRPSLPPGTRIQPNLFRQANFIASAIRNVEEALRDGSILVVIVLFAFLLNFRTTAVTLTAIPLSLLATALVFRGFGLSLNTMTLGGIAVAIGELVDDAIVDVENVFRRLRENRHAARPLPVLTVIFRASSEIRNAIVLGTAVVLLVFLPLFALSGVEGRLFRPLAVAYIVSILMSLVVSLTVTPVLCSFLLPGMRRIERRGDGAVLRACKAAARAFYGWTFPRPGAVAAAVLILVAAAAFAVSRMGAEFLPPFNEGTATINVVARPGVSLSESNRLGRLAEREILAVPEVKSVGRRTGRAEQDEHAEGVHYAEVDVDYWTAEEARDPASHAAPEGRRPPPALRPRKAVEDEIERRLLALPGVSVNIGQPISHRIDHLLSGVRAAVAVKIEGPDLGVLRRLGRRVESAMKGLPGVVSLQMEQQMLVPQVRLRVRREAAARFGFQARDLTEAFETAFRGRAVSQVLDGARIYDLVLWTPEKFRRGLRDLADLRLVSPSGAVVLLSDVADVVETPGPNQIGRENVSRRILVSCNVRGRDLGSAVKEIQKSVAMDVELPPGYSISYGGQFESQARATRRLLVLGSLSLAVMFAILFSHFRSAALATQVMLNVPFAFIGSVAALVIAGIVSGNPAPVGAEGFLGRLLGRAEPFSVASLVGFISLTGVASRNGILMITHYMHLMAEEGEKFSREMVIRGSQERVAPVLMTALTAGLALIPLVLSKGEPGKEILYPVALVVLGGLLTSTLLDFAVTPAIFYNWSGRAAARAAEGILEERRRAGETGEASGTPPEGVGSPKAAEPAMTAEAPKAAETPKAEA